MDWKKRVWKFNGKMSKEKWLLLLLLGVLLMILSFPMPGGGRKGGKEGSQPAAGEEAAQAVPLWNGENGEEIQGDFSGSLAKEESGEGTDSGKGESAAPVSARGGGDNSYEAQLEARIKEILKSVDGVGKVDVMVVLKSSSEKVVRVDRSSNVNTTQEKDSGGGTRDITSSQSEESTVLSGSGGSGNGPIIEKELSPEISGIIISAEGGGSPSIKAEISGAMEALFGLPPHKIKVLKRVE